MSVMIDAVLLGWALAALLFGLALLRSGPGVRRLHRHAALAGALVLMGAALFAADIINMPEIAGALVIGAAIGLPLARELPMRLLPRLMAGLAGSAGLALVCAAIAMRHNPYAFGLLGEADGVVAPWRTGALAIALLTGAMAGGAGLARGRTAGGAGFVLAMLLALLAGASLAQFASSERLIWLAAGLLLALPAGSLIGARMRATGEAALLGSLAGLVGWAASATGFLLENGGLVIAGGAAAMAGTLLALRLCAEASGKGLADGRRHA